MELPQSAVPEREAARLAALRRLDVLDTPEEEAFDGIVRMAAELCAAPIAAISLVDVSRIWFKARTGLAAREVARARAFCNESIHCPAQELLIVRDAAADARFAGHPLVAAEPGVRFYAGTPLVTGSGEALGTLCVMDCSARGLDADQSEALVALAEHAIAELELRASRSRFAERYRNALLTAAPAPVDRVMADLKRAEQALMKSEARFRSLTALTSDWYWEQDAEFRYVYISHEADTRGALGMKARAGKTRWELPWSGVSEAQWAAHRAQLEAHEVFRDFEIERPGPDGGSVWVSVSGEPIFDTLGNFTGYRGITRNITERRAAEQLLRLEHQVTRALSDAEDAVTGVRAVLRVVCEAVNMGCGRFFKLDEAAGVLRFHDGWCQPQPAYERFLENSRQLAFRPGEGLAGIIWQTGEAIWSSDTSRDPRVLGRSLAQNSDIRAAFAFAVRSEGKLIGVLSFSGQTAREPDARLLQAASIIGSQTGQFLQRNLAEQALAASEARFRAIFERSSAGMAISDAEGKYLTVNAAFARFFGYSAEEIVGGLKVSDLRSPDDAEGAALYQRLVSGEIGFFERERQYRRKDGAQIWGHATVSAIRDAGGKAAYVVAVFSDITEMVLSRARIERMNAELEERVETRTAELREALKELDAFTYSVSHDLRAPVGAVSGFAHLLRSSEAERLSEDGRRLLDFIEHNADRMTRLIEGLLRFSRLGRSDLRRMRVSMNGLAGESLLDFVDEIARSRVNAGSMPDCTGDPGLLGQVWSNLVGNALKYSRNADAPCIDIGWDAGRTAYFVRDNGVGFDMAYAGKLFGVFERLHHESEFEGSGIGLAIAERIIRLHGGSIWADAALGRGATFWFKVPE